MVESQVTRLLQVANTRHGPSANLDEVPLLTGEHDHLSDPAAATSYLDYMGIPHPDGPPAEEDVQRLRELRDAARAVADVPPEALAGRLGPVVSRYAYRYTADGDLVPVATGWEGFAAEAAPGLFDLVAARDRLRTCANPGCGWLFIDRSRNHSRVWCEMSACGSRAKMTRYRRRRREAVLEGSRADGMRPSSREGPSGQVA